MPLRQLGQTHRGPLALLALAATLAACGSGRGASRQTTKPTPAELAAVVEFEVFNGSACTAVVSEYPAPIGTGQRLGELGPGGRQRFLVRGGPRAALSISLRQADGSECVTALGTRQLTVRRLTPVDSGTTGA